MAQKNAKIFCQNALSSEGSVNDFYCKEVTLFSEGCYVRCQIGTGYASDIADTLNEADNNAKNACNSLVKSSKYSCLKDTIKCIEKMDNQGSRNWNYIANGITETFKQQNSAQRVVTRVKMSGYSRDDARAKADEACIETSGKKCKVIVSTEGDQCVAVSYDGGGEYAIARGRFEQEKQLISKTSVSCKAKTKYECLTYWSCDLK